MKVLILVQSVEAERYPELVKTQQETWDSIQHSDVKVLYYYPINTTKRGVDGNRLYVSGSENPIHMFTNTIFAFREVLSMEWDFILKTDNSAYINKQELVRILNTKSSTRFYGGHLYSTPGTIITKGIEKKGVKFLWGEGYVLSRDLVTHLIDVYAIAPNKRQGVDDCHIGDILTNKIKWDESMTIQSYYLNKTVTPGIHIYRCVNDGSDKVKFDDEIRAMKDIHLQLHPKLDTD